jgi:hypothetical protein
MAPSSRAVVALTARGLQLEDLDELSEASDRNVDMSNLDFQRVNSQEEDFTGEESRNMDLRLHIKGLRGVLVDDMLGLHLPVRRATDGASHALTNSLSCALWVVLALGRADHQGIRGRSGANGAASAGRRR